MVQTNSPGSVASVAEAPYDAFKCGWLNPGNAAASDGAYASITDKKFDTGANSHVLYATGFGFTIPLTATITGIELHYERYYSAGGISDALVQIVKGGTRGGDNKSTGSAWNGTDTVVTFGGAADLWGQTWTPAEINAGDFGIAVAATATSDDSDAHIDHLSIVVHYSTNVVTAPSVDNDSGASGIASTNAVLNGEVTDTGGDTPAVTIYWGPTDGVTTPSAWSNSINMGLQATTFSSGVSGLLPDTTYYYRCYATNSAGEAWAPATTNFTTLTNQHTGFGLGTFQLRATDLVLAAFVQGLVNGSQCLQQCRSLALRQRQELANSFILRYQREAP